MELGLVPTALLCFLSFAARPLLANVITNGGFETGDFTGWSQSGNKFNTGVTSALCPGGIPATCLPHSGSFAAYFGDTPAGISQTVVTDPAATYTLDFWVKMFGSGDPPATPNEFQVVWNGNILTDIVNSADGNWEHMTFSGLSASSSSTLAFNISDFADWIGLDDVTLDGVSSAPEPATISLLGLGIALAAVLRRSRA